MDQIGEEKRGREGPPAATELLCDGAYVKEAFHGAEQQAGGSEARQSCPVPLPHPPLWRCQSEDFAIITQKERCEM